MFKNRGQRPIKDSNLRAPSHPRYGMVPNHDGIVAYITSGTTPAESNPDGQRGLWTNALVHCFPHHPDHS